jgi:hypothetical protein
VPWLAMMQIPALHTGAAVWVTVSSALIWTVYVPAAAAAAGIAARAMPARGIAASRVRERWSVFIMSSISCYVCGLRVPLPVPGLRQPGATTADASAGLARALWLLGLHPVHRGLLGGLARLRGAGRG